MVAVRIIPCLDVRAGRVVKGVRFRDHVDMGDIIERAQAYRDAEADELVFYDITASPENRSVDVEWVERVAAEIDIPFAVAGGIGDVERARAVLHAGADKISVNSPALKRPALVRELADAFGSQCVVIGIDSIRDAGRFRLRANTGDPDNMIDPDLDTRAWVERVQRLGAGEIVLNCMDADGVRTGYDVEQLAEMRAICDVPLIASGGAGAREHFLEVFERADVDGALAATVFHSDRIAIPELKEWLSEQGVATRHRRGTASVVR
ncbi:MAG: imidazole glycerol phosphate synthase subunit HisF [Candidatus Wenzhouxiangella sp. M2_3B_020]